MLLKRVKIIFVHQYALLSKKPLIGSLLFLFLLITVFVILQSYTTLDCNNTTGKCLKRNNRSTNSFILGSGSKSQNENGQDQGHGLRQSYDSHNINSNNDNLQMGTTTSTTGTKNRKENNNKESYPKDEEHLLLQLQQRVGVATTTTTPENDDNNNSNNIDNNENDENVDAKDSLENYAKVKGRNLQIAPKLKIKINNENDNGNINDDSDGKASSQQQQREQREQQEQQQTIPIQLSVANVASSLDHLKANSESTPPVTSYQYISLPMSGDSKRGYTVSVSFPGSSKVFSLIVDSGSTDVAVAGENCCGSLVVPGLEWTEDNVVGETKMG